MARTLENLILEAQRRGVLNDRSKSSINWFMQKARKMNTTTSEFIREYSNDRFRNKTQIGPGKLYSYFYDPKHKETLPYYDRFPMIFILEMYSDRFLGINLHYLPYKPRVELMDALLGLQNNARIENNKKLKISYSILKASSSHKLIKPCIKMYLKNHVKSKILAIPPEEWSSAIFLPVQQFQKKSSAMVFNDSYKIMRG